MKKILFTLFTLLLFMSVSFGQFGAENLIAGKTIGPSSVISCDINGDGHMDILSASRTDDKIAWYKNNGLGEFGNQQVISTEADGPFSIFAEDFDMDGDIDIISASIYDDKIFLYKNNGFGLFETQLPIADTLDNLESIHTGDIDGDGDIDILSSSGIDMIIWHKNNGFGLFETQQVILAIPDITFAHLSDIDGDGDMDIISNSSYTSKIAWYENIGNGQFGTEQVIPFFCNPNSICSKDLDNDGDNDIIAASFGSKLAWYENDGLGNFDTEQIITIDIDGANSVYTDDIDSDGDIDIFSTSTYDNKLAWYENDGTGQFGIQQIITTQVAGPNSIFTQDIDGDGELDVLYSSWGDNKIAWQRNDGFQNFGTQQIITISTGANAIYTSDLDGDGDLDVLSASGSDIIAWYKNDGLGQFGIQQIISDSADNGQCVKASDLDNDGDMDVISASANDHKIAWYENDNLGNFSSEQIISSTASPSASGSIFICDLNGDSNMDIISANYSYDELVWFENDGLGNFSNEQIISTDVDGPESIYAIDLDADGDIDVLSVSRNDDKIAWYKNDGTGVFGTQEIITSTAIQPNSIYASDLDNDGDMDILSGFGSKITCYKNDGLGQFGSEEIITNEVYSIQNITTSDIDGDGDIDILSASHSLGSIIAWYENDGQGNFGEQIVIESCNYSLQNISYTDIDADGDMDIISGFNEKITWYENFFGSSYKLKGNCFFDQNQNEQKDTNEQGFTYSQLELNPNGLASYTNQNGEFWFAVDTGNYVLTHTPLPNWSLTTDSAEYHIHLTTDEPIADSLDFGFYPSNFVTDINPELTASPNICGSSSTFWINYLNQGTTNPSGVVELILDDSVTYVSSAIVPDSINGQNIYWHFDSLNFFASGQIPLTVQVPDFNSMGDTLVSVLNIYTTDSTGQFFFTDTLSEELACSYDPNDKLVTPRGLGEEGIISKDETLEYTVRFQNTGNAEAINIKIRDQIDANLDIESIEILASSDDVQAYIQQNRWLVFQFDSIMLPDSTANELESHGFVKFSIRINDAVLPNTQIFNTAHIYFDYNPAVITNTVMNTIECYIAPEAPIIAQNGDVIEVTSTEELQWFLDGTLINGATSTSYEFTENGNYTVLAIDENNCFTESEIYTVTNVGLEDELTSNLSVYPNPTKDFVVIESDLETIQNCSVYSIDGQLVKQFNLEKEGSLQKTIISTKDWGKGIYIIKLGELSQKLVVE